METTRNEAKDKAAAERAVANLDHAVDELEKVVLQRPIYNKRSPLSFLRRSQNRPR